MLSRENDLVLSSVSVSLVLLIKKVCKLEIKIKLDAILLKLRGDISIEWVPCMASAVIASYCGLDIIVFYVDSYNRAMNLRSTFVFLFLCLVHQICGKLIIVIVGNIFVIV